MRGNHSFILCRSILALCTLTLFAGDVMAVTIDTVLVGDAGNVGQEHEFHGIRGAVAYNYRIGTTEVTNSEYAEFLNAKAKSDPLALYSASMGSDARGGIMRDGVDGSYTYSVKPNMGKKPVNFVSLYDAMRFTNWLHNGQDSGDTEDGAYTLDGLSTPSNFASITRNAGATWFLPSENEWYKAAYYQPVDQGGDVDSYWDFPTRSNSPPTIAMADSVGDVSNPGNNVVNYLRGADWNGQDGNVTTVGSAGPLSKSYYGTSDQAGNVAEWTDTHYSGQFWILGNGDYRTSLVAIQSSSRTITGPAGELSAMGFRVATIPEPNTSVLAAAGLACCWVLRLKRRRGPRPPGVPPRTEPSYRLEKGQGA